MTTKAKTAPKPEPVTAPAIPADEAFGNIVTAERDTAVVEMQALQSQLAARNGQYERDLARLEAEYNQDALSLTQQIGRQGNIIHAADFALEALKRDTPANVVPLRQAGE